MTPPEDEKLIKFLRDYSPTAPPNPENPEVKLFELIEEQKTTAPRAKIGIETWLTGILTAIILLLFGQSRIHQPSVQVSGGDDRELEAFLVDNWNETTGETVPAPTVYPPAPEKNLVYSTYYP